MAPTESEPGLPAGNVIAVLDQTAEGRGYLVASLEEDGSNKDAPFKLSLHEAAAVPASLKGLVVKECPSHLRPPRPVHVVVSVKSGTGLAEKAWEAVVRPLLELLQGLGGRDSAAPGYSVLVTQDENSVKGFARGQLSRNVAEQTVILLSGDGGTSDILNARSRSSPAPTIAILPLGTGNALFHSLHKPLYTPTSPSPLTLGLRTLCRGTPSHLPVVSARFPPGSKLVRAAEDPESWEDVREVLGAVVFSHGFHASLVWESDTPRYRVHGAARFGMVAEELLRESHAYGVSVSVRRPGDGAFSPLQRVAGEPGSDGDVEKVGYLLVAMVSNLEKTFAISPAGRPLDGRMRLVHFGAVGGERTMEIMKAAYDDGRHVEMGDVGYEEVEGVEVDLLEEDARWRKVCVDGIIVEVPRGRRVCLDRAGSPVRVLVQGAPP